MKHIYKSTIIILMLSFANVANAQPQRMKDFQSYFDKYQPLYQQLYASGKYQEALAPLNTLIALLDTTTIYNDPEVPIAEAAIIEQKSFFQYDKACCLALLGQKKQALATLDQSVNNGYKNYNHMQNDKDFASLKKDKKFQALLAEVGNRCPLNVLKKSAHYAKENAKDSPFIYQPKESLNLRMVRDYFKLDSIAGNGDELSKIINLLHYAHDNIRHDGGNRAFAEMDAIDIYNYYKTTGRGVNCRQLAISLCEMYLAMGIPARYVTCMPADPLDYECHVINCVWSSQLQKWLYIDPTMDAWVMDENGTMLSIAEVRERLIDVVRLCFARQPTGTMRVNKRRSTTWSSTWPKTSTTSYARRSAASTLRASIATMTLRLTSSSPLRVLSTITISAKAPATLSFSGQDHKRRRDNYITGE